MDVNIKQLTTYADEGVKRMNVHQESGERRLLDLGFEKDSKGGVGH
jgi:hypothetical protein